MTVRINKQKINLREKLTEFEDKVNFDEVVRGLGEYTGNVGIGTTSPVNELHIATDNNDEYDDASYVSAALQIENTNTTASSPHSLIHFRLDKNGGDGYLGFTTDGSTANTQHFVLGGQGTGECFRIKSNGSVGIGTTNPGSLLEVYSNSGVGNTQIHIHNDSTGNAAVLRLEGGRDATNPNVYQDVGQVLFVNKGNITAGIRSYHQGDGQGSDNDFDDGDLRFLTSDHGSSNVLSTRMVINKSGNVGIGITDPETSRLYVKSTSTNQTCRVYRPLSTGGSRVFDIVSDYTGVVETVQFLVNTDGVTQNTSGTISQISSDERLKENISDATPKLQDLLKLKVKNFNFSDDENRTKYIGFIAQEMEEVFPSLVMTKDTREYDEDGNLLSGLEDSKSTKVSMDFAILTKAIQEQQSIIEDLKSRIETLESK